jgi:phosphoglycerate-specific signal transduction histidine kinase
VAHELRQPLAAASNYIGVARLLIGSLQGDAAARALHSLGEAEAQLIRAGKILGRLSRAARPESPERD